MKTYELTYIISPEMTPEEAGAEGKEIESLVSSQEGTIIKQSSPSVKTFSYPIGKSASGFLGVLEFNAEPEKLSEIKNWLAKDEKIIRQMIVIKNAPKLKKERRSQRILQTKTQPAGIKAQTESEKQPALAQEKNYKDKAEVKEKIALEDIEQELEEILSE